MFYRRNRSRGSRMQSHLSDDWGIIYCIAKWGTSQTTCLFAFAASAIDDENGDGTHPHGISQTENRRTSFSLRLVFQLEFKLNIQKSFWDVTALIWSIQFEYLSSVPFSNHFQLENSRRSATKHPSLEDIFVRNVYPNIVICRRIVPSVIWLWSLLLIWLDLIIISFLFPLTKKEQGDFKLKNQDEKKLNSSWRGSWNWWCSDSGSCGSCQKGFKKRENGKSDVCFRCPKCVMYFCPACDDYIHDSLHNCPGCEMRVKT